MESVRHDGRKVPIREANEETCNTVHLESTGSREIYATIFDSPLIIFCKAFLGLIGIWIDPSSTHFSLHFQTGRVDHHKSTQRA